MVRKDFFQHFGIERKRRGACVIHRSGQRRPNNLKRVETHKFLPRLFNIISQHMGHRLQSTAEPATALAGSLGNTLDLPLIAGQQ